MCFVRNSGVKGPHLHVLFLILLNSYCMRVFLYHNNTITCLCGFTEKQGLCSLAVVNKPSYPCVYLRTLNQFMCDAAKSHVLDKLLFQNIWV